MYCRIYIRTFLKCFRLLFFIYLYLTSIGVIYSQQFVFARDTFASKLDSIMIEGILQSKNFTDIQAGAGKSGSGANSELAMTLRRFTILIDDEEQTDSIVGLKGRKYPDKPYLQQRSVGASIMNRVAVTLDSARNNVAAYLFSLDPSPVTFRLDYDMFLDKGKWRSNFAYKGPLLKTRTVFDIRSVPFQPTKGVTKIGYSFHLLFGLQSLFRSQEVSRPGQKDIGIFYCEPYICTMLLNKNLKNTFFSTTASRFSYGFALKIGYLSLKNNSRDVNFYIYYSPLESEANKFNMGINIKSI